MLRQTLLALTLTAIVAAPVQAASDKTSIIDVALSVNEATQSPSDPDGEFATLIAAVLAADPSVLETLDGNGQFTVFAPTDAAFATLGLNAGNVGTLPQDALTNILAYHVARGDRDSTQVVGSDRIRMLNKQFVFVEVTPAGAFLVDNDADSPNAQIVTVDVEADNGVIHVIDNVILP